jgi:hypothetical protein
VEIESAAGKVRARADGLSWKITAPEAFKPTPAREQRALAHPRPACLRFLDESAAGIPRYLSKPDVTVRIWEEWAKEPKTLLLGLAERWRAGESSRGWPRRRGQGRW